MAAGLRRTADIPEGGKATKIELVRRAAVVQSTTETWQDVALTLSTARPIGATAAPDIEAQLIDGYDTRRDEGAPHAGPTSWKPRPRRARRLVKPWPMPPRKRMTRRNQRRSSRCRRTSRSPASRRFTPFQAASRSTTPARPRTSASTPARSRPGSRPALCRKLDPNAYLTAAFTLNGETPLLPGTAMLYRDGVFMGQGYLPLLSPGEEARLGFGADDLIKVKRTEVKRQRGEEGLLTTSNVDERAYDITVKNLHDFAIPVTVIDQMPYSVREDITVETLPGMTPPSLKDFERKRGVLAWNLNLKTKAEKVLNTNSRSPGRRTWKSA